MIRLLTPFLLAGCRCPSFAEMEVEDPEGLASNELLRGIREGIRDFARWSDVEGVCVQEIQIVPAEEVKGEDERMDALYEPDRKRILISARHEYPDEAIRHELCHAWDEEQRHWSQRHDEVSAAIEQGLDDVDEMYDISPWLDEEESFARTCMLSPVALDVLAALGRCAPLPGGRAASIVRKAVFPGLPPTEHRMVGADFGTAEGLTLPAVGDRDASFLTMGQGGRHLVAFELIEACWTGPCEVRLLFVDLVNGDVSSTTISPPDGFFEQHWPRILSAAKQPLLVLGGDANDPNPPAAWLLDPVGATATSVPLPEPLQESWFLPSGWIAEGGSAWVSRSFKDSESSELLRWDLGSGEVRAVEPRLGRDLGSVYMVAAAGDRMAAIEILPHSFNLLFFGESEEDWAVVDPPLGMWVQAMVPLDRERALLSGGFGISTPTYFSYSEVLALWTGEEWQVETADCWPEAGLLFDLEGSPVLVEGGEGGLPLRVRPVLLP